MSRWFFVTLLFAVARVSAQQTTPAHKPTAQVMLILPAQLGNPIFDRLTSPLGEVDAAVQFPLKNGLGIGIGGKMMWWELKANAFAPTLNTPGEARRSAIYAKLQYAHYTAPNMFYEVNVKAGSSKWIWDCTTCAENYEQQGLHWAATAGYYVHASDNLAFGVTLGYEADVARFSPAVIEQDVFPGYAETGGPYRFLTVGLGFSTRFEKAAEERW